MNATVVGCLIMGCGALVFALSLWHLLVWFFGLIEYLDKGGTLKYECSWFYFSYNQHEGFLIEFGNIDKPTAMFSIFYMTRGAFDILDEEGRAYD